MAKKILISVFIVLILSAIGITAWHIMSPAEITVMHQGEPIHIHPYLEENVSMIVTESGI